ncbi:hypothetical protein ARMGADRAFT_814399 [Armillaria gallica]|uniref:Uncharacterized protein n=1 Tax=Armillaria gallica TaxID=47427 RepID=A0A2H3CII9_ARMGA|nr:hypothetical protein ARMGADRAFT_814399 [Armillaria gallica]
MELLRPRATEKGQAGRQIDQGCNTAGSGSRHWRLAMERFVRRLAAAQPLGCLSCVPEGTHGRRQYSRERIDASSTRAQSPQRLSTRPTLIPRPQKEYLWEQERRREMSGTLLGYYGQTQLEPIEGDSILRPYPLTRENGEVLCEASIAAWSQLGE